MKKVFLLVAVMATMMLGMQAQEPARVPAYRGLIERVQPNGDTLRTYLRGDEHKHWMMTEDGWQILEIGDKVIFLRLGKLEWQGNRKEIYTAQNEALEDFVFASELFKNVRRANT